MSIIINFSADTSALEAKLDGLNEKLSAMSWADMAMGVQAVIGLLGQARSAVEGLASAFLAPAAALEDVAVKLGTMLGNDDMGKELAGSLERMATNGVVPLEELTAAAGALVGVFDRPADVSEWVGVFADISAGSKLSAARLAELVARLDDMGKAELTELANAGIPIFEALSSVTGKTVEELRKMSAEGKIGRDTLLAAFRQMTAEGGKFYEMNARLSNTTAGSWETLKASWTEVMAAVGGSFNDVIRPMLQGLSEFLQEHKEAVTAMVKMVVRFAAVWAGIKVAGMVAGLMKCVAALLSMVAAASKFKKAMAVAGGLVTLASAWAADILQWGKEKLFGSDDEGDAEEQVKAAEEAEREAAKAEREAARAAEELAKVELEATEVKKKEVAAVLDAVNSVAEFEKALRDFSEEDLAGYDVEHGRWLARVKEEQAAAQAQWEELQRRERNIKEADAEAFRKEKVEAFGKLGRDEQVKYLEGEFARWGVDSSGLRSGKGNAAAVAAMRGRAAEAGMTWEWNMLQHLARYAEVFDAAEAERTREAERLGANAAGLRGKLARDARRDGFVLAGDEAGLAAFDDEQERQRLSAEYQAAGLSAQEADFYAGQTVARKRKIADAKGEKSGVQVIASSMASVGGGGVAHRLGDAQLLVSRKQLGALEAIKEIVSGIAGKATGIPVVS